MFKFFFGKNKIVPIKNTGVLEQKSKDSDQQMASFVSAKPGAVVASSDLDDTKAALKEKNAEYEILLNSLFSIQEALESSLLDKEALYGKIESYREKIIGLEIEQNNALEKLNVAQKDLNLLKEEASYFEKVLESNKLLEQKLTALNQDSELLRSENLDLLEKISKIEVELVAYNARVEDHREENLALITSLNQIQEELEQHFLQKQRVQQDYNSLRSRWGRIERNHSNLLDYDDVRLITVDTVSSTPYLVWEAKNFYHANVNYPKFHLVTLLNEGRGGLAVLDSDVIGDKQAASRSLSRNIVFPYLLAGPKAIAENYKLLGSIPWKRTTSGIALLEEILLKIWPKGQFPKDMDPSFWRTSLTQLLIELKQLPKTIVFEKVSLKRELRNSDYEHVWLEIDNLQFGNEYFIPKFEMRIGASLIQSQGFSRYPKFEFPLISGMTKPFESWYAESSDEYGSKFEVRFDLNKGAVDFNALSKLSRSDCIFLINVILSAPQFLQYLEVTQVPVARTWATWKSLAEDTNVLVSQILQSLASPPVKNEVNSQSSSVGDTGDKKAIEREIESKKLVNSNKKPTKVTSKTAKKAVATSTTKGSSKLVSKKLIKKK